MTEPVLLAFEDRQYTRSELDALTSGMATMLEQRGVRPGDRVALMSSNRPEFVVAMRAIWGLGAAVVLLSSAWKRAEVEHALALTKPAHAVGDHPVLAEVMPMLHLDEPVTPGLREFATPDPDVRRAVRLQLRHHRACRRRSGTPTAPSPWPSRTGAPRSSCRRPTACRS